MPTAPPPSTALRSAAYSATFGASLSAALPAGYAPGDLLLAVFNSGNGTVVPSLPAGWTSITSGQNSGSGYRIAYKVASGGEGSTVEVSGNVNYGLAAHIYAYIAGAYTGTPTVGIAQGAAGPGPDALPSVTPAGGAGTYEVVAGLVGNGGQLASGWPFANNQVNTASTGTTGVSGTQSNIGLCTGEMTGTTLSPGNITNSMFANWSKLTIALKRA